MTLQHIGAKAKLSLVWLEGLSVSSCLSPPRTPEPHLMSTPSSLCIAQFFVGTAPVPLVTTVKRTGLTHKMFFPAPYSASNLNHPPIDPANSKLSMQAERVIDVEQMPVLANEFGMHRSSSPYNGVMS